MQPQITTFLMFEGQAEQAMNFYIVLFPDSRILDIARYGPEGPGAPGSVYHATFQLNGRTFRCIDSPVKHGFTFTPAMSLFVDCGSAAEVETLFAKLSDGGQVLMPLDAYPFSPKYAWVNDRFGVSWQIGLMR
jgi:predicted 3-demethylubiquinone-9 3-methyltransferase (glyoxalase superfamily)